MNIIRPHITLVVLLVLGLICAGLMWIFPVNGIPIAGDFRIHFKTWHDVMDTTSGQRITDVEAFLAQFDSTTVATDSIPGDSSHVAVKRTPSIASLQFSNDDSSPFFELFQALDSAASGRSVHIYHYGDSQIETDQMTGMLRQKLQQNFGGHGPGLASPLPVAGSSHVSQSESDNWKRYTAYGYNDGKPPHNRYGVMCSFVRFTPPAGKTPVDTTKTKEAWFEMRPSGMAQPLAKQFNEATIYFGNNQYPFALTVTADDKPIWEKQIGVSSTMQQLSWSFATTPRRVRFIFRGVDSPDVYAVSMHDTAGVLVSNIPLRGNDGSVFRKVNAAEIKGVYSDLGADLVILQFGGNALPYVKSETSAKNFGQSFQSQIRYVKSCAPNAAILVIGPSDMSTTINGEFQTWPYLEAVRDAMKEAAFIEGCAFWDMYAVMGGKNSMVSWVTNKPPYAGPDYTHFTKAGANKMAELLYKAITDEYNAWKAAHGGI